MRRIVWKKGQTRKIKLSREQLEKKLGENHLLWELISWDKIFEFIQLTLNCVIFD